MSDVSRFLQDAYQAQEADPGEFTLDPVRRRQLLMRGLLATADQYSVHFLAAAILSGAGRLEVQRSSTPGRLWRTSRASDISLSFNHPPLSVEQLRVLPDAIVTPEDRVQFRLSLALNPLIATKTLRSCLESTGEYVLTRLMASRKIWRVEEIPRPAHRPPGELRLTLENSSAFYGRTSLEFAARFTNLPVVWGDRRLGHSFHRYLQDGPLWAHQWLCPSYPLPLIGCEQTVSDDISIGAFVLPKLQGDSLLVCLVDNTPLPAIPLLPQDCGDSFLPGLLLVINGEGYSTDISQGKLVRSEKLFRLVRSVLAKVKTKILEQPQQSPKTLQKYLVAHPGDFGGKELLDKLESLGPKGLTPDPYSFSGGYERGTSLRLSHDRKRLLLSGENHLGFINLSTNDTFWEAYTIESIVHSDIHPTKPLVALGLSTGLLIKDLKTKESVYNLALPGITKVRFSRAGRRLVVLTRSQNAVKAWVLSAESDYHLQESLNLDSEARVGFCGDHLLVVPVASQPLLYPFEALQPPVGLKMDLVFRFDVQDVSFNQRYAVIDFNSSLNLVDLRSGNCRELSCRRALISPDAKHLFCEYIFTHQVLTIPELEVAKEAKLLGGQLYPNGRVIETDLDGEILNPFCSEELPPLEKPPTSEQESTQDFFPTPAENQSVLRTAVLGNAFQSDFCIRSETQWEPIARFHRPNISLTPDHFLWQSSGGVHILNRHTGTLRFEVYAFLLHSFLARKNKDRVQLIATESGKAGFRARLDSHVFSNLERSTGYWTYRPVRALYLKNGKRVLIEVKSASVLEQGRESELSSNLHWSLRENTNFFSSRVQFKRQGARWKTIGKGCRCTLHPTLPAVIFPTETGFGVKYLDDSGTGRGKLEDSFRGGYEIFPSPSGRFVAILNQHEVAVLDFQTGSWLSTLWARCAAVGRARNFSITQIQWLNDRAIFGSNTIWTTDDGWLSHEGKPFGISSGICADGSGDIICYPRAGQIDFLSLSDYQLKATLHVTDDEWFIYTPDGKWDCSLDGKDDVKPRPKRELRSPGLLTQILAVPNVTDAAHQSL